MHLPLLEDMLSTCMNLLQETAAVAFPVIDLLVTMCNHNHGEDCLQVISYLIQHLKSHACRWFKSSPTMSCTLALELNEKSSA